jgi:hypothetical protein
LGAAADARPDPNRRPVHRAHYLEPLSPAEAAQVRMSDVTVWNIELILADRYEALVVFFDAAARAGQCTVFWAA